MPMIITLKAGPQLFVSEVKNESGQPQQVNYEVVLTDMNGKTIKTFTGDKVTVAPGETKTLKASSPVTSLNFWSRGYGYLYNVQTSLSINGKVEDVVTTKTGFRKTAFKDGMIYLNHWVMMVHRYVQRTSNEWPAVGLSVLPWLSDYSNGMIVEGNGNLVRSMHIMQSAGSNSGMKGPAQVSV